MYSNTNPTTCDDPRSRYDDHLGWYIYIVSIWFDLSMSKTLCTIQISDARVIWTRRCDVGAYFDDECSPISVAHIYGSDTDDDLEQFDLFFA